MNVEELRAYCLRKSLSTEGFPFGNDILVFKVAGKMFALTNLSEEVGRVNLKCDPERAVQLRNEFEQQILPGYHMNRKHWNTVVYERLPTALLTNLIDHSYDLVVAKLPKRIREQIKDTTQD